MISVETKKINNPFIKAIKTGERNIANISSETLFVLVLVVMLLFAIPFMGYVLGKDAQRNISIRAAESLSTVVEPSTNFSREGLRSALETFKLGKAPMVVGMTEQIAVTKLTGANVERDKIEIKHEKMTYPALVERSDTLFFGQVETQNISKEAIKLLVPVADLDDPFTAQMYAMGSRLAWPVPGHDRISSHFGHRSSPGGIGSTNHQGLDIPAPTGTPIIAVKAGVVESAGRMGGYGNCVVVDHKNGFKSLYGHMSQITCNAGDEVKPGDVIGKVGSTGWSTGPHLHFGLLKDGQYIDPEPFFTGRENLSAGAEVSINNTGLEDPDATNPTTESDKKDTEESEPTKPSDEAKPDKNDSSKGSGSNTDNSGTGSGDSNTSGSGNGTNSGTTGTGSQGGNNPVNSGTSGGSNTGSNPGSGNTGSDPGSGNTDPDPGSNNNPDPDPGDGSNNNQNSDPQSITP